MTTQTDQIDALPAIHYIAQKILTLKLNTQKDEIALFELLGEDPPIMAKVIGLSNSPQFGLSRTIYKLHDAMAVLGTNRIKMVALSFAMMSSLHRNPAGLLNSKNLMMHSLSVAMGMETLSHYLPMDKRPSEEEIFLAGLVHDIGYLVLDFVNPLVSDQFQLRMVTNKSLREEEIEKSILDRNHCELGALLARHWKLPRNIVNVLQYHHTPFDELPEDMPLVGLTSLVERMQPTFKREADGGNVIQLAEWEYMGIDSSKTDEIEAKVMAHKYEEDGQKP